MSHEDICSFAEPWILLPQIYALKKEGSLSEYSSHTANIGITDFIKNLPQKEIDYKNALRTFMFELYTKQCRNNEIYFLDKTPRYYLIIDEIVDLFPNAKFIFLFRNPVHVYASIVNTWGKKRFNKLFSTYDDIFDGTSKLSNAYLKYKEKSIAIKYEDFVSNPTIELKKTFNYLNINYDEKVLINFNKQKTKGSLGDPTGVKKYNVISPQGLDKWKETFNSYIRKKFALRMIRKLSSKDLETQGYSKNTIVKDIKELKNKKNILFFRDLLDYLISYIFRKFKINLFINSAFSWIKKKYIS